MSLGPGPAFTQGPVCASWQTSWCGAYGLPTLQWHLPVCAHCWEAERCSFLLTLFPFILLLGFIQSPLTPRWQRRSRKLTKEEAGANAWWPGGQVG